MIIELLLSALYNIFKLLTTPIAIPSLPTEIDTYINDFIVLLGDGFELLGVFFPLSYFGILLGIIIAIDVGINVYYFVLWVLKKIPMANIN